MNNSNNYMPIGDNENEFINNIDNEKSSSQIEMQINNNENKIDNTNTKDNILSNNTHNDVKNVSFELNKYDFNDPKDLIIILFVISLLCPCVALCNFCCNSKTTNKFEKLLIKIGLYYFMVLFLLGLIAIFLELLNYFVFYFINNQSTE